MNELMERMLIFSILLMFIPPYRNVFLFIYIYINLVMLCIVRSFHIVVVVYLWSIMLPIKSNHCIYPPPLNGLHDGGHDGGLNYPMNRPEV